MSVVVNKWPPLDPFKPGRSPLGEMVDAMRRQAQTLVPAGVWMAYDADAVGGDAVPFASEVEALRYAVANHMKVRLVKWGEQVRADAGKAVQDGNG